MKNENELQKIRIRGEKATHLVDVREFPIFEVGVLCISFIEYDENRAPFAILSIPASDIVERVRNYTPEYETIMVNAAAAAEAHAMEDVRRAQEAQAMEAPSNGEEIPVKPFDANDAMIM